MRQKYGGMKLLAQLSYYTKTAENMPRIGHACLGKGYEKDSI